MVFHFCSLPGENFVSIDVEAMSVLLGFSLTTGNLNNVLDALQILMGKQSQF